MSRTGRPRLAAKKKRSERVPVMFTAKELEIIQQRARKAGDVPVSTWIRSQILKALEAA